MEGCWDELWLATGKRMNIAAEAVLAPVADMQPVQAGCRVRMLLYQFSGRQHLWENVCVWHRLLGAIQF